MFCNFIFVLHLNSCSYNVFFILFALQHDSFPQQSKSDQLEKLRVFKTMLERIITFLQVSKSNIPPGYKDNLGSYEVQIVSFINTYRPKKPALQQGQFPAPHMQSMQQPQSQLAQMQSQTRHANGADWQEEIYQRVICHDL